MLARDNFGKQCSFCGKFEQQVRCLLVGERGLICNECVQRFHQTLVAKPTAIRREET
ncbi:MAG: hypothetical protein HC890_02250 [Chloroflexaceae bacterium]|nr:hypothetical protein [Chloroflexaceae bacterium]